MAAALHRVAWLLGASGSLASTAAAQPANDARPTAAAAEHEHEHDHMRLMTGPLGISRARMGSGTSWLPDSSPMYGFMAGAGDGGFMVHGNAFAGYDAFASSRGSERFIGIGSIMGMAWQPLGGGEIMARVMLSAEPATVGRRGYPLVLQTGETLDGEPIHDRQHPHDLFMELALAYTVPVSTDAGLELYIAPAGEPALGPTAFPHRVSAISDPLAPLGHHWQDSTHIAFGVVTAGVFTRRWKLEGSWFNGREPDDDRWNLDLDVPDSLSTRLTWNPVASWSLQTSYGRLSRPEAAEPDVSLHRVTASATYDRRLGADGNWATTFVFGENMPSEGPATPSSLVETNWNIDGRHVLFGRAEYVKKTRADLALPRYVEDRAFHTGMLAVGYVHHFGPFASLSPGLGVRGAAGIVERALEPFYRTRLPLGAMIFVQLCPAAMSM